MNLLLHQGGFNAYSIVVQGPVPCHPLVLIGVILGDSEGSPVSGSRLHPLSVAAPSPRCQRTSALPNWFR